ncbi:MAG: glycerol-3-phosphate 1-O-acyltransferase PlsY [Selenomonadaceae bacterium]|nr:glycerol-3-phosphate 1-O-acyltransferase PlsY [Selenomonadaceae bacterium]
MTALVLIVSYLLGSIPNGLIFGRLIWKKDLRRYGSGNLGATNAWRVLGKPAGLLIFALDFMKGVLSVMLAQIFAGTPTVMVLAGLLAILGHACSIFLKFKGGRGVATGLGVIAFMMPAVTSIVFLVWLAIVLATRYVSLGSIVAAVLVPILALVFGYELAFVIFGVAAAAFITFRHKENIVRLLNGRENKI